MESEIVGWETSVAQLTPQEMEFLRTASVEEIIRRLRREEGTTIMTLLFELTFHPGGLEKAIAVDADVVVHTIWTDEMVSGYQYLAIMIRLIDVLPEHPED